MIDHLRCSVRLVALIAGLILHRKVLVGSVLVVAVLQQSAFGQSWEFVTSLNTARQRLSATQGDDGFIYAVGGRDPSETILSAVERYNPATNTWLSVASLNVPRLSHEVINAGGLIYSVGGANAGGPLVGVETYDVVTNTWTVSPYSLNVARTDFGLTKDHTGKIYAIGGFGAGGQADKLASVEVFDPASPGLGWQLLGNNLNDARGWIGAGTDALGRIYAIAGATPGAGFNETVTVERFDPVNPAAGWQFAPSLNQKRQVGTYATASDGSIFVLGGWAGGGGPHLSSVEVYDLATDSWLIHSNMNRSINHLSAAFDNAGRLYAIGGEHFGTQAAVERIPEPASLSLLALGVVVILQRHGADK